MYTMSEETDPTFVRRKFTITEELDGVLNELAENNYQGNVSLCLRQAIVDHRESLHNDGQLTLRRLVESVRAIETQLEELETSQSPVHDKNTQQPVTVSATIGSVDDIPGAVAVLTEIDGANGPLRGADIIEQVTLPPVRVRQTLGRLVDRGILFTTEQSPPRYYLAADSPAMEDEQQHQHWEDSQ